MPSNKREVKESDVKSLIRDAQITGIAKVGGQKVVVPISLNDRQLALKIVWIDKEVGLSSREELDETVEFEEEALARVKREVEILSEVDISQLATLGPVPIARGEIDDQPLIFYTEEWIDGESIREIIDRGELLSILEIVRLGRDMSLAIEWLWKRSKIHRDIKPSNVIRRSSGGFVLLDMGLTLDFADVSLTRAGVGVGTLPYFSPEQLDIGNKRNLDCRSDMYSLGLMMYEAATGRHPYYVNGMSSTETIIGIQNNKPLPPIEIRKELPESLNDIILRLLEKVPHLRYRTCSRLIEALNGVDTKEKVIS